MSITPTKKGTDKSGEFKTFAMRGNVMDMAIGIIIGGAFGKIVSSFVNDILMPPLGTILGGMDFTSFKFTIKQAVMGDGGEVVREAVSMNYGTFIQVVIDFLIIAWAIFMVIKVMNRMKKKEEVAPAPAAPPPPSNEEKLLTEIRDILSKK